uniref:Uncharacterized protein n=1 Tax=Heterosigma akashiwo TaxID=2829 RepID=A0A7S3XPR3_HETAK
MIIMMMTTSADYGTMPTIIVVLEITISIGSLLLPPPGAAATVTPTVAFFPAAILPTSIVAFDFGNTPAAPLVLSPIAATAAVPSIATTVTAAIPAAATTSVTAVVAAAAALSSIACTASIRCIVTSRGPLIALRRGGGRLHRLWGRGARR